MAAGIVTLTSDFGQTDGFVGTMKGVILGINPDAKLIDISHDVAPQNIREAAFVFGVAHSYFPRGTIHLVVVDPGVGTGRRPIVVLGPNGLYIGPDNGVLSYVLAGSESSAEDRSSFKTVQSPLPSGWGAYRLTNVDYWLHPTSSTFHGRDIFAPVAAHLSMGIAPNILGEPIEHVSAFAIPKPKLHKTGLFGCIIHVDRYGNLVTNINIETALTLGANPVTEVLGHRIEGLSVNYQSATPVGMVMGSHGYIEISAANASAAELLDVNVGDTVRITKS